MIKSSSLLESLRLRVADVILFFLKGKVHLMTDDEAANLKSKVDGVEASFTNYVTAVNAKVASLTQKINDLGASDDSKLAPILAELDQMKADGDNALAALNPGT